MNNNSKLIVLIAMAVVALVLLLALVFLVMGDGCAVSAPSLGHRPTEPSGAIIPSGDPLWSETEPSETTLPTEPACEHTFKAWAEAKKATCKQEGLWTRRCTKCDLLQEATSAKLEHSSRIVLGTPATCLVDGKSDGRECSLCGEVLEPSKTIQKLGHNWQTVPAVEATCYNSGLTEGVACSECGEIRNEQKTVEQLDHSFSNWTTTREPNCGVEGLEQRVCRHCGKAERNALETVGTHQYSGGICTVCGKAPVTSDGLYFTASGDGSYYICTGVDYSKIDKELVIPGTHNGLPVKCIKSEAFWNCHVEVVVIGEGVEIIEASAFANSSALKQVFLPASLRQLAANGFRNCYSLSAVHFGVTSGWYLSQTACDFANAYENALALSGGYSSGFYIWGTPAQEPTEPTEP